MNIELFREISVTALAGNTNTVNVCYLYALCSPERGADIMLLCLIMFIFSNDKLPIKE